MKITALVITTDLRFANELCLKSLYKYNRFHKLIIVNNGQSEENRRCLKIFKELFHNVSIIQPHKNIYHNGGLAKGLKAIKTDWAICFDNDIRFKQADLFKNIETIISNIPKAAIISRYLPSRKSKSKFTENNIPMLVAERFEAPFFAINMKFYKEYSKKGISIAANPVNSHTIYDTGAYLFQELKKNPQHQFVDLDNHFKIEDFLKHYGSLSDKHKGWTKEKIEKQQRKLKEIKNRCLTNDF